MKKFTQTKFKGTYAFIFVMTISISSAFAQSFTEAPSIPFTAIDGSTHVFADIDGDTDLDLLNIGDAAGTFIAELYKNDGSGIYTLIAGTPFTGVEMGGAVFGDVDGDGDLDVIISGDDGPGQITKMYFNNGTGVFTESLTHSFSGIRGNSALALGDLDGDGDLDFMLAGWNGSTRVSELHLNNGLGTFTLDATAPFSKYDIGTIDFADVDGDLDLDVLITGKELASAVAKTELYLNNGTGTFTLDATATATIENVRSSDAQFADIDGDGDLDVIVSGWNETTRVTKLYTNVAGVFTLHDSFEGFDATALDFADVDNDSDLDLVISGKQKTSGKAETELYLNDGSGSFSITTDSFVSVRSGDLKFEDIDGDGDSDVIISGWDESSRTIKLYINTTSLGVEDFGSNLDQSLKVFYNNGELNVKVEKFNGVGKITLFDILGRNLKSQTLDFQSNSLQKLPLNNIQPGIYILNVQTENNAVIGSKKFIINN